MSVKYRLYYDDVVRRKDAVGTGKLIEIEVMDTENKYWFPTRSLISRQPIEGGEPAALVSRVARVVEEGEWYIKIVERIEEEEEEVTVFESKKFGDRRGYMLKSMMAEQKAKLKQETMTEELESRLKRKQEIVKEVLDEEGKI